MKRKLLVTGLSGFLGHHLLPLALGEWNIHAIIHQNHIEDKNVTCHKVSLLDYNALSLLFSQIQPHAVLQLAAVSNTNTCEIKPWETWKVNVEASINLAKLSSLYNIPYGLASTDLVFDGKTGNYSEQDNAFPINRYGKQKLESETLCLKYNPTTTVFRLPLMLGNPYASQGNYLRGFLNQYDSGAEVSLFEDEYRSVCGASSVAKGILQLLGKTTGVMHLAGKERLSRYEFGLIAAEVFGLDTKYLKKCRQADVPMAAPRPADVSLNSNLAFSYGYKPLLVREELLQLKSELDLKRIG